MKTKMEKLVIALFGIVFLSVLSDAQDIGRIRRLMLLRQRELALRRAAFPFGVRGIGGPGIPPPVAARLALIQRQRALSSPFLRSSLGPLGTPFSPFAPGAVFELESPFGPRFSLPGPTDMSRFDVSTLGFPTGATFGGPDGLPVIGTDGLTTVGDSGITTIGSEGPTDATGRQGGSGNIFGQQPTQAEEFLETNRGTVEPRSRSNANGRAPGQPPITGFRSQNADSPGPRAEGQRMQRPADGPPAGGSRTPEDMFSLPIPPPLPVLPHGPPQLGELIFPPPLQPIVPLDPRRMPPRSPGRSGRFEGPNQQRSRRVRRQRRGRRSRGPRVFPNVPDVVQIPSVTPTAQGQPGGGQTGLTQAGAGQMGGQMNVQTGGQAGGQIGAGQFGGQATGSMGGSMTGTMGGPTGGPMGGPVSGPIGGTMGGPISGPIGGSMGGPMGGPVSGQMGGSMGGPMGGRVSGQMGGSMGGPMGGRVSGPMGGSMGGPMGGRVSGPMRGSMGGPMGGPISGPIGGTMSRPMGGSAVGQFGGQMGGPFGRQVSGPFGGRMTGPTFSFGQPSSGQFSAGTQTQGGQGSAIFPSQATQGPIIRQRGPGFTPDSSFSTGLDLSGSSTVVPGFPNGPALQFPDGARAFGQSDQLLFPRGGFSPEALSTTGLQSSGFQGFPRGSFGQSFGGAATGGQGFRPATFGPSFDATPTSGQIISQTSGGSEGQSQATSNFGFVRPSDSAAGPAFNTGTQPRQNFNIQFQPLQPGPQVPQIPEQQPTQGQMGLGTSGQANTGLNNGFSSQGNIQFGSSGQVGGSSQSGLQFGGSGQTGIQTGGTDQNSKFTNSGSTTVVETNTEQQSGTISFGSNRQGSNSAATTISERTVEAMAPVGNAEASTEFRLVEVGNILGDKGFVNNDATSGSAVAIETTSGQQGSAFQPAGDITTAFRSFEAVDGSQNFVDLSLEPTVTMTTAGSTVSKTDTTGSVTVTNTSETKTVMSVQDGPFARSINQDFSFFMDESNQAPNEMPPITFNAPEPPAVGSGGTQVLTFPVQGTGSTGAATSNTSQGFSLSTNSVTSGKTVTGPVQPDTTTIASDTTVGGLL